MEPNAGSQPAHPGQNLAERLLERVVIVFAQAMVALAIGATVYGFLVMMFFFCWGTQGVESTTYFNPARSPFGPVITVLLVWPIVGLLCLAVGEPPGELFGLIARSVRRILHRGHDQL